jgi:hypothetical protein
MEGLEDRTLPATVTWTNPLGGNWSTASNWSTGKVPTILDDVIINQPGGVTITHSGGNDLVHSLSSTDPLVVSGGYLFLAEASTLSSSLTFSAGTLTGGGDLTVNDLFTWTGGTLSGRGSIHANGGFTISGTSGKTLDTRSLDYTGTATWSGSGGITLSNHATWNNLAGATLQATGNATLGGSTGTFNNAGLLSKPAGTGTTTINTFLVNSGTVDAASGTLNVAGNNLSSGSFTVEAGATLAFNGGTQTLQSSSTISGAGDVTFGGATIALAGTYSVTGTTTISKGTVNFDADNPLPALTFSGGTLGGTATLTLSGQLTWTGGMMTGGGHTVANGNIAISGDNKKELRNRILDNAGTATWTGNGALAMNTNSVWNNLAGAFFIAQNGDTLGGGNPGQFGDSTFNNAGTLQMAGSGVATVQAFVNNTGTIDAASGVLNLADGGLNSGTNTVEAGATLGFTGGNQALTAASGISGAGNVNFGSGMDSLTGYTSMAGAFSVTGTTSVLTGGTVSFDVDTTLATLTLLGGTLTGASDLTVSGVLTWRTGTMTGAGRTLVNGDMLVNDPNKKELISRTLNTAGTTTWTAGDVNIVSDGVWNNLAGATLNMQSGSHFGTDSIFRAEGTFNNAGLFTSATGSGTASGEIAFNNSGTVDVVSGVLNLAGGGISTGTFIAELGGTLEFGGGSHSLMSSSSVSGDGTVIFDSEAFNPLSIIVSGSYTVTGPTFVQGTNAPVVAFDADTTLGALNFQSGTLMGEGDITITGRFDWTGGKLSGTGNTFANGGMNISGSDGKTLDGRILNNAGTATWTGTGNLSGGNDALFNNLAGAVFDAQSEAAVLTGNILFINAGTFQKSAGSGTTSINVLFSNTGTVDVESGTLKFAGTFTNFDSTALVLSDGIYHIKGTLEFNNAKIVTNEANIVLDGSFARILNLSGANALANFANNLDGASFTLLNGATVTTPGDFNNLGTLVLGPGSLFKVTGDYTQTSGATLEVQLGGTPASGKFGQLAVTGTAALDGTLTVNLVSGYSGVPGDRFAIMTFARLVGSFASTNLPPGASLALNPGDVTVSF